MFKYLKVKSKPETAETVSGALSAEGLARDGEASLSLTQLNSLPDNTKRRIYRGLIPSRLLAQHAIDPITWKGPDGSEYVRLDARPGRGNIQLSVSKSSSPNDEFIYLELADNAYSGIDLNFLVLSNPDSPRFTTDTDEQGNPTLFGSLRRNLAEEERAMQAGLAPGQVRSSLGGSAMMLQQIDAFLGVLGHRAYFLEPLTYASAWIFERRGFAYVRGHKLMDDIQLEFQPGGRLHQALDGRTPFRQPGQEATVRGRAWAIHDGILEVIDARWDKLRMVKQIGRIAGVETFPQSEY
jgi:hypothetical protein